MAETEFKMSPGFSKTQPVKPSINIGACLDIPTGEAHEGQYGETIVNGGLAAVTGVVGTGNRFKSTFEHYQNLTALDRILSASMSSYGLYDTEMNTNERGLRRLYARYPRLNNPDIIDSGIWEITDKVQYYANEWFEIYKTFLNNKRKAGDKLRLNTPFLDRDGKNFMKFIVPTFQAIDSFSEFETADVAKILDDNELGESGGNTVHMRQGLAKTRFLMELPALAMGAAGYTTLTAHVGKEIVMASGPMTPQPTKKLGHQKAGDKIKGVTDRFFFLMLNCWDNQNAKPYINQGTKGAEYPRMGEDPIELDPDLNIVTTKQLRGKNGLTGYSIDLLISQSEGVLPELTEFHNCKTNDRWGLNGSDRNYSLALKPDVSLQRTTVRTKLQTDPLLARAMNITSEMLQIQQFWPGFDKTLMCTPQELFDDLKSKGYDWDQLLSTRGWWTLNNEKHEIPFLSTPDLLRMRAGLYKPYWM
jgi:hypothetical protein